MRGKTKRRLSILLALVMMVGLLTATQLTASADNENDLVEQINNFDHGGQGELEATVSPYGNIVTVNGSVYGANKQLHLKIEAGNTVNWRASYSGTSSGANRCMFVLTGGGTFEVDGNINDDNQNNSYGTGRTIVANFDPGGCVRLTSGHVSVTEGDGVAIYVPAGKQGVVIDVEDGRVSAINNPAIYSEGDNVVINVNYLVNRVSGGTAIYAKGASPSINIRGGGMGGIYAEGDNASITMSGGHVSIVNGHTISANGQGASVTISGGDVKVTDGVAVVINGQGASATISGGEVRADEGIAVAAAGVDTAVTVSGGVVSANDMAAIGSSGVGSSVTVNGGYVFAYGTAITGAGNVIHMISGTPTITSPGLVCAWNWPGGTPEYAAGSSTGLILSPANATALWDKKEFETSSIVNPIVFREGIRYASGANTGFFPIDGVTLTSSMNNFVQVNNYSSGKFSDVNENAWYGFNNQKVIATAYNYGLMQGDSPTIFNPAGSMTIAEAVAVAARVHRIYTTGADDLVQSGDPWYTVYTDYAIANGIIGAGDFPNYNQAATRAQMAYIFSRSLPNAEFASKNIVNSLPDVNSGTPYYSAILTLYKAGILAGNDDIGTFKPGDTLIRAEAAAIISRVILPGTRTGGRTFG